jgi:diaminopimelate decarboxylase
MLERIANEFGTPCFVYDLDAVRQRATAIKTSFGGRFELSYAVKANPNLTILRRLKGIVELLDVSSGGELRRAILAGWDPRLISFTGPGKSNAELQAAVDSRIGCVILESVDEAERLSAIATRTGREQPVLVRIAPATVPAGFGVGMAGKPCQFGIDEEDSMAAIAAMLAMRHIPLKGFHIYSGTQCLKPDALVQNYENFIRIFRHLSTQFDFLPERLIFGSALGVPYYPEDKPLDLDAVARLTNPRLDELRGEGRFAQTAFSLELGRYLIGEAGRYLTRVHHIKRSRGVDICVCDGGMNHHLAACGHLGTVIPHNYRLSLLGAKAGGKLRPYEVFGPLCTTIDRLARNIQLPELAAGDVLAVECSGAYGLTASPIHFISHAPPKEILWETVDGVRRAEDITEISV